MIKNPSVYLWALMCRDNIPLIWGRRKVLLKPEEKISVDFSDRLRVLTLEKQFPCVWSHLANEGKRSPLVAIITKAMGMIPGAGDYVFCWATGSGFIELKYDKNKQTERQKYFEKWCNENGVKYALCYSADSAIETLKGWGLIVSI